MEEKDHDETKSQFAKTAFDAVNIFCSPQPSDTCEEKVRSGTEDSEGEIRAIEAVSVYVLVEAEVASVVADRESDGEEINCEEDQWIERRVCNFRDGVDVIDHVTRGAHW